MTIWLSTLAVLLTAIYAVVRLAKPVPVRMSRFELDRRAGEGDVTAIGQRERLKASPFLWALWWFVTFTIALGLACVFTGLIGGSGFIVTVLLVLSVAWLEQWKPARRLGQRLYEKAEPRLFKLYGARKYFFFLPVNKDRPATKIESEAELLHLLQGATFLEPERRALMQSSLEFTGLTTGDAMSGRRSIRSVDKSDVLGPLMLDELYKTGKQSFVVTNGDLDTVVGVLKLERLTSLDVQDSLPALKAMTPEVHFIDESTPITDALSYLRSSKAPFLVVQDANGRTVGLLTMDNILRCLFES